MAISLSPLNFSFWSFVKESLQTTDATVHGLVKGTYIAYVNAAVLQSTWDKFQYFLDICCITKGMHIKHLQKKLDVFL